MEECLMIRGMEGGYVGGKAQGRHNDGLGLSQWQPKAVDSGIVKWTNDDKWNMESLEACRYIFILG